MKNIVWVLDKPQPHLVGNCISFDSQPVPDSIHLLYPDATTKWPLYWFDTDCAFVSYKGIQWVEQAKKSNVRFVVTHTNSEKKRFPECDKFKFVPLHLTPRKFKEPSRREYVFIGGRKDRDWHIPIEACESLSLPYVVCADLYKGPVGKNCIKRFTEQVWIGEYQELLYHSRVNAVSLKVGDYSHGHSDVVRGLQAGSKTLVTRGASCDDYENYGAILVDDWIAWLKKAWDFGRIGFDFTGLDSKNYQDKILGLLW